MVILCIALIAVLVYSVLENIVSIPGAWGFLQSNMLGMQFAGMPVLHMHWMGPIQGTLISLPQIVSEKYDGLISLAN